jgi:hypothetical protein
MKNIGIAWLASPPKPQTEFRRHILNATSVGCCSFSYQNPPVRFLLESATSPSQTGIQFLSAFRCRHLIARCPKSYRIVPFDNRARNGSFLHFSLKTPQSAPPNFQAITKPAPHALHHPTANRHPSTHHAPLLPVQPPCDWHGGGDGEDADCAAYGADHGIAAE